MFFIIAALVALLTVCSGESSTNQNPAKHAISSQSYHRDDVPLSYKHSFIHISTHNPVESGHKPHRTAKPVATANNQNLRIQYAPPKEPAHAHLYTKAYIPKNHNVETALKKDHLEPKIFSNNLEHREYPISSLDYIPGQSIQIMQSGKRFPGHNAVYRSYLENTPYDQNDIDKKVYFLQQYLIHSSGQRPSHLVTQSKIEANSLSEDGMGSINAVEMLPVLKPIEQVGPKSSKKFNGDIKTKMVELPPHKALYQKMHPLFLNVARSYNFAPAAAAIHAGANPAILGRIQFSQPLPSIPGISHSEAFSTNTKTRVFPGESNRHFVFNL